MPVKFLEQAFLFFAHEYGQVIFAERKLEMDAPHIRVNDMRFDIERTVGEPGAACGIVHIIERKGAGLQIAETKLYRIRFLLIKERKRSDVLIVGSLAKMNFQIRNCLSGYERFCRLFYFQYRMYWLPAAVRV